MAPRAKPLPPAAPAAPAATPDDVAALAAASVGMIVGVTGAMALLARQAQDRDEFERRKVLAIAGVGLLVYGIGYVFDLDKRWYDFAAASEWAQEQAERWMRGSTP